MNRTVTFAVGLSLALLVSGCLSVSTRTNPARIPNGGTSVITTKIVQDGKPLAGKAVKLQIIDGEECGSLQQPDITTDERGVAITRFTGVPSVENCTAVVRVTAEGITREAMITVNAVTSLGPKIDGVSAIAVILIASFAIDRIIVGFLFLISFIPFWSRWFPEPEILDEQALRVKAEKKYKLVYFSLAALLGMLVLGWYGRVRILAAVGFSAVDPMLDTVITGLILVGGADRTSDLLKRFGASENGGTRSAASAPIQVSGRLVLEGSERKGGQA